MKFLFQQPHYRPILKLWFVLGLFWTVSNLVEIWIGHPLLNELPSVFGGLAIMLVSGADHAPQHQHTVPIILRTIAVLSGLLALGMWLVRVIQFVLP